MADTKLADLTALTTPSGDDILYIVDDPAGTPLDRKIALDNLFTRGTLNGTLLNMSQTWGGTGTYTGIKYDVTDSGPSNAASLLMDLQVGGVSQFKVNRSGTVSAVNFFGNGASAANGFGLSSSQILVYTNNGTLVNVFDTNGLKTASTARFGFTNTGDPSGTTDTILTRRAAANLRLGDADAAAPVAQTLSVQSVVAGTTNTAGTNLTITGSQGTGTGAGGSIIFQVAPAGSSGSAQNALSTALTIGSDSTFTIGGTNPVIIGPGNTGRLTFSGSNASLCYGGVNNTFGIALISPNGGSNTNLVVHSVGTIGFSSTSNANAVMDIILARDASNTLALRNGGTSSATVPQTFNQYEYWASASDYSRISLSQSSIYFFLQTQAAGSGTKRGLILRGNGTNTASFALVADELFFGTAAADYWKMSSSGHFLAGTDNLYDIGASGATRPRSVYAGTSITPGRGVTVAGLPTPSTGMIARVTDATAPVIGATVAGGGAAYALVNYNGANWTVIGV